MVDNYDGFVDIEKAWSDGLTPDPLLLVSEWADKYRVLPAKSSDEAGRWRTQRTPYLKEIMDSLSPSSPIEKVTFMKGAQVGGTETGNNLLGYIIHIAPGPTMAVSPTVEMAKRNSRQRIETLINDCPELRARIAPARSRDSGNTILSKDFHGGMLVLTGANSAVGLRSMSARYLFLDEIDGWPVGDLDGEGDPQFLVERRTATFRRRRKILLVSTPTVKSTSRILREFEASDQRYYFVPCPHCGVKQSLKFTQLHWTKGNYKSVYYICEHCHEEIYEHHKTHMLLKGEWIATSEGNDTTRGYHLSSLYSPVGWYSWEDVASDYEKALLNPDLMKGFINTVLGEAYEDEYDAPEWERLYERRDHYPLGIVPSGGLFLTAGVDVQRDRIECEIVAWGRDKISWSVDYHVLDGDTAQQKTWNKLDKLLAKDWPTQTGATLPIRVMCVDSGFATQDVYSWVRQHPQPVWGAVGARASQPRTAVAIKGRDNDTALIFGVSKADTGGKRKGLRVWGVSGPVAKTELYRWLKLPRLTDEQRKKNEKPPHGSCFYPQYGEEYFKQLTAEKKIIKIVKGYPKAVWEKDPTRNNEALDCRVYARAAATIYGLDRFKEIHWRRMEKALGEQEIKRQDAIKDNKKLKKTPSGVVSSMLPLMQRGATHADDPYL